MRASSPAATAGAFGRTLWQGEATHRGNAVDFVILVLLWACFAGLITVHVALAVSVGKRRGPLWGWLGLLLFPLLPYFAIKANVRAQTFLWLALALVYPALLMIAMR